MECFKILLSANFNHLSLEYMHPPSGGILLEGGWGRFCSRRSAQKNSFTERD